MNLDRNNISILQKNVIWIVRLSVKIMLVENMSDRISTIASSTAARLKWLSKNDRRKKNLSKFNKTLTQFIIIPATS